MKHDDHERTHEEGCVALLGVVERCVVVDLVVLILLIVHEFFKFLAEQVHLSQIEGTKVSKEWRVDEVIVDAEVESMLTRLGWILVTDPVQASRDNFNRLVGFVASARSSVLFCLHE